jgi:hypothetical protein
MNKYDKLISKHGTLIEFSKAINKAYDDLFITSIERDCAISSYRLELEEAKKTKAITK